MRALSVVVVMLMCVLWGSLGVEVRDGERSFPLEAVKKLKELMDFDGLISPHLVETRVTALCSDPTLPDVFQLVCKEKGTAAVFYRLADVITPPDPCEICANPSCFGCLK